MAGEITGGSYAAKKGINPEMVDSLQRLAIVGSSGMGALTYEPENRLGEEDRSLSLDQLSRECERVLQTKESKNIDELFQMGGSSGGARPKVNYEIDGEDWIVKFASSYDGGDIGIQEYKYSLCAKKCGIPMEETRLMPSNHSLGYFATKRFDRRAGKKMDTFSCI